MSLCPVCNNPVSSSDATCPACGFKLLGTTQEFSLIELDENGRPHAAEQRTATRASLTVVRGEQIGTVYVLDDKEQTIGRSPQCDILLNDMTVSREHAVVYPSKGGFCIRNLKSYNGVWVNNKSVDEAALRTDDIIQIGSFCLLYEQ